MYNQSTSGRRRLRGLALVPAVAIALAFTDIPAVASVLSTIGSATIEAASSAAAPSGSATKVTENAPATQAAKQNGTKTAKRTESNTLQSPQIAMDKRPQFPGGDMNMFKYVADNIKYTPELLASKASGRVIVKFVVQPDGSLTDFTILESFTPDAATEALRVLKAMPKWEPGISNGKAVSCSYVIPITFKYTSDDEDKEKSDNIKK